MDRSGTINQSCGLIVMDKDEQKRLMKEAMTEWLDQKFSEFGRLSFTSLAAAGLVALIYLIFWSQGWHR